MQSLGLKPKAPKESAPAGPGSGARAGGVSVDAAPERCPWNLGKREGKVAAGEVP